MLTTARVVCLLLALQWRTLALNGHLDQQQQLVYESPSDSVLAEVATHTEVPIPLPKLHWVPLTSTTDPESHTPKLLFKSPVAKTAAPKYKSEHPTCFIFYQPATAFVDAEVNRAGITARWSPLPAEKQLWVFWYKSTDCGRIKDKETAGAALATAVGGATVDMTKKVETCDTTHQTEKTRGCLLLHLTQVYRLQQPSSKSPAVQLSPDKPKLKFMHVETPDTDTAKAIIAELQAQIDVVAATTPYTAPLSFAAATGTTKHIGACALPAPSGPITADGTSLGLEYEFRDVAVGVLTAELKPGDVKDIAGDDYMMMISSHEKGLGGRMPAVSVTRDNCQVDCILEVVFGPFKAATDALPNTALKFMVDFFQALSDTKPVDKYARAHNHQKPVAKRVVDVFAQLQKTHADAVLDAKYGDARLVFYCWTQECHPNNAKPQVNVGVQLEQFAGAADKSPVLYDWTYDDASYISNARARLCGPSPQIMRIGGRVVEALVEHGHAPVKTFLQALHSAKLLVADHSSDATALSGAMLLALTANMWMNCMMLTTYMFDANEARSDVLALDECATARKPYPHAPTYGKCTCFMLTANGDHKTRWGYLIKANPRTVFAATTMPAELQPDGAFGKLITGDAAHMAAAVQAFAPLMTLWATCRQSSNRPVPDHVKAWMQAMLESLLAATFGNTAACSFHVAPKPLPLMQINHKPALVLEIRELDKDLEMNHRGFVNPEGAQGKIGTFVEWNS